MLFFYTAIAKFNKSYALLFGTQDKKGDEEGEEQDEEGEDNGGVGANTASEAFIKRWSWVHMVNQVSDITKETWDSVYQMPIVVFLNIACYLRDKNEFEKASLNEYKSGNIKRYGFYY